MDDAAWTALCKAFPRVLQGAAFLEALPAAPAKQPPLIAAAFSPDESMVALSGGGRIPGRPAIWIARTDALATVAALVGHQGVHALAWDPRSSLLASASNDYTVVMWDLARRDHLFVAGGNDEPIVKGHVAFADDALFVGETEAFSGLAARLLRVSLADGAVTTVRALARGRGIGGLAVDRETGAWAYVDAERDGVDSTTIVTANGDLAVGPPVVALGWRDRAVQALVSTDNSAELRRGAERLPIAAAARWAAFSPDGAAVAVASATALEVHDDGGRRWSTAMGGLTCVSWSPSAQRLCVATFDRVAIIDARNGRELVAVTPPGWFRPR